MASLRQSKYGYLALALSLAEPAVIWGGLAAVYEAGVWGHAPQWLEGAFGIAYLAGIVALALAILGLVKDSRRRPAGLALLLALVNLFVCAIALAPMR
jgi:hypothetical protein